MSLTALRFARVARSCEVFTQVTHASRAPSYLGAVQLPEGTRTTAAIWVAAALIAVFAVFRLTAGDGGGGGSAVTIDRAPARAAHGSHGGEAAIYVHVAGAVRAPGLLKLPAGTRVATAVQRAGGRSRGPTSRA